MGRIGSIALSIEQVSVHCWQMSFDDYKVVLYRNEPDGWVAEIPAISEYYALMPTREDALRELADLYRLIADEYEEEHQPLPADTTEIVHA